MFRFGKTKPKKEEKIQAEPKQASPEIPANGREIWERIQVLPERFYVAPKKSKVKLLFFIILVILLASGVTAAVIFSVGFKKLFFLENRPIVVNTKVIIGGNENINQNFNVNEEVNNNINTEVNQNFNENINLNTETNFNTNLNTNLPTIPSPLPAETDEDNDGLTAAEENLFGVNPQNSDSDGDGYADGAELLSGYNPTQPKAKLENSNLIKIYRNSDLGYSLWYPASWSINVMTTLQNQAIFNSLTGESFIISTKDNLDNLSLDSWYQRQFPQISLNLTKSVKINNLTGLEGPDKLSYYLINPNNLRRVFVIVYNPAGRLSLNFATTFQVFVKSFKLSQ